MNNLIVNTIKIKNILTLMWGLFLMAAGVALSKIADLGTSPIASIPNVFSYIVPLPLGSLTILFLIILVFLEALILKNKFSLFNILQIIPGVLFGLFINLFMNWFSFINVTYYYQKLGLTFISILILGVGVYFEVSSHSIIMPGEGLANAIVIAKKIPFHKAKVIVDSSMVVVSFFISILFFHRLVGIREGTILSAVLVGKVVLITEITKQKIGH